MDISIEKTTPLFPSPLLGKVVSFDQIAWLKDLGYSSQNASKAVLPMELIDLISVFYIFKLGQKPIGLLRHLDWDRKKEYDLTCGYDHLISQMPQRAKSHLFALIAETKASQQRAVYSSNFVMHPDWQRTPASQKVKELIAAISYAELTIGGAALLFGGAVPKFRTDKLFQRWGYQFFRESEDSYMKPIKRLGSETQIIPIWMKQPSDYAEQCYYDNQHLFESLFQYN